MTEKLKVLALLDSFYEDVLAEKLLGKPFRVKNHFYAVFEHTNSSGTKFTFFLCIYISRDGTIKEILGVLKDKDIGCEEDRFVLFRGCDCSKFGPTLFINDIIYIISDSCFTRHDIVIGINRTIEYVIHRPNEALNRLNLITHSEGFQSGYPTIPNNEFDLMMSKFKKIKVRP